MKNFKLLFTIFICLIYLCIIKGCITEPEGFVGLEETEAPKLKIVNPPQKPVEGITWIDYEVFDRLGMEHVVGIRYNFESIGVSSTSVDSGVERGQLQFSTFSLPEGDITLDVVASDNAGNKDTTELKLQVIQRTLTEFWPSRIGGKLKNGFHLIRDGACLADGSTWLMTKAGLLIFDSVLRFSMIEYSGMQGQTSRLQQIIVTDEGEPQFLDSVGRILRWDGIFFVEIGKIEKSSEGPFVNFIFKNGEYFAMDSGAVLRYNHLTGITKVYDLTRGQASAFTDIPEGQLLAAYYGAGASLFRFDGNEWSEILLPPGEPIDQFDDFVFGRIEAIVVDRMDRIWLARGESLLQLEGNEFKQIRLPLSFMESGPGAFCSRRGRIIDLVVDNHGDLWIANDAGGLMRYNFERFFVYPGPTLSEKHFSCFTGGIPRAVKVIKSANGGIFVSSEGNEVGFVLTHFSKS